MLINRRNSVGDGSIMSIANEQQIGKKMKIGITIRKSPDSERAFESVLLGEEITSREIRKDVKRCR